MLEIYNQEYVQKEEEPPSRKCVMNYVKLFSKHYETQLPGLCGPALLKVVLKAAKDYQIHTGILTPQQAVKIRIPDQRIIASEVMTGDIDLNYWPVVKPFVLPRDYEFYHTVGLKKYCLPESMAKYLGKAAAFKENQNINTIAKTIRDENKAVAILWNEEIPDRHKTKEGGHWSLAVKFNKDKRGDTFTMIDTSMAERVYDARGKVLVEVPDPRNAKWQVRHRYTIDADYLNKHLTDHAVIDDKERVYKGAVIVFDLGKIDLQALAPVA